MPTIELNRKEIEKIVGKKLVDSVLKERISMFGTPVEELTKEEIKIEVFPNRPDLLSEQGFGRAFSSFLGIKKGLRKYAAVSSGKKIIVEDSVSEVRPFTACAIVKNLKFDDEKIKEAIKIQEKLHITFGRNRKRCAIGIYPLDKITFPVRYLARNPSDIVFRPLESKINMDANEILKEHPTGKEYAHLLEGKSKYPIFIDAKDQILSMPPIINSHDVGKIGESTKDVFIECSGFDLNVLKKCINIIVAAFADMGGTICSVDVIYGKKKIITPELEPEKMRLDSGYANKRLGLNLSESKIKECLEKMGFGYESKTAKIPAYRADILHPIDLVEDIAIAYGYENFAEEIPKVSTIASQDAFEKFKNSVTKILVGMGLDELNSTSLIDRDVQTKKMLLKTEPVMLFNSLTSEYNSLRSTIMPGILQALQQNKNSDYPQEVFEIGTIFNFDRAGKSETGITENTRLTVMLCHKDTGFTDIKQKLDRLFSLLGIKCEIRETEHSSFISGRAGRVSVNKKDVAYVGELHPKVIRNFDMEMPISAFELNLTDLFEQIKG